MIMAYNIELSSIGKVNIYNYKIDNWVPSPVYAYCGYIQYINGDHFCETVVDGIPAFYFITDDV